MPINMAAYLLPSSPFIPYLLEDVYFKGGYRCVADIAARDKIHRYAKKVGMKVYVQADDKVYKLGLDGKTWEEDTSGISADQIAKPLMFIDGKLTLDPKVTLPENGEVGQVPMMHEEGVKWTHLEINQNRGIRNVIQYTSPKMQPGDEHLFDLPISRTALLLQVKVNTFDIELKGYGNADRDEINPYTFVSKEGYFEDEGIKYDEKDDPTYMRRNAVVANRDDPVQDKVYFTVRNIGGFPAEVTIDILYMVLE